VRGARDVLETAQYLLGIKTGQTTEDYKYSLERVACVGSCAMAPIVMIDNEVHPKVSPLDLKFKLMDKLVTETGKKPTEEE
jgi:NADH-quinone oxidoreductase subunit E